ncbi:guanylate kinase [Fructobacillus sp. M2-14]|uniref:Guanylate kinase n=1 Tax=Fructobacillus broussonetiae TaxID=2713173 RepID=A0ABS5R0I1_9LACO|nr:guanylate kinase [Fructobacillus broussonetiae]MBS9338950.1 guanylate kinase [Fructobacillus broussonetiae]
MQKRVIVIMGATGVGKTSICSYIGEKYNIPQVITHTTRPMRDGEADGVDYYFETPASFKEKHFLESVSYAGNSYGSSMEGLKKAWAKSDLAVTVLDTKGGITYKEELGDQAWLWYVTVSDQKELVERLHERGDGDVAVEKRINSAEFKRDLKLPEELEGNAEVLLNDDWKSLKAQVDGLINQSKANARFS